MNSCFNYGRADILLNNFASCLQIRQLTTTTVLWCLYLLITTRSTQIGASAAVLENPVTRNVTLSKHPVIIVVSFDGFRYDYMLKTDTPNLDKLKAEGVSAPYILNQFPTKTFPNHHSIATGLHTESHGVTDNKIFDTELNKTLTVADEEYFNYRDDVLPLWTLNELAGDGRHSGTMMWPGSNFGFGRNKTHPTYNVDYDPHFPFEQKCDIVIQWITNTTSPANLVFMYFDEPDGIAHGFGPDSPRTDLMIQRMDNVTGYFIGKLRELGIFSHVNLIFLSDHGFQEVPQDNVINISDIANASLYDRYGSTPVYNINPIEGQLDALYNNFYNASKTSNFSVYRRSELGELKRHWFYQNNPRRIMPLILVADSGFAFDDFAGPNGTMAYYDKKFNVSHVGRTYGVHGYDNHDRKMQPYFVAHGHLFASGGKVVNPFFNVDLFPLICKLLDFPAPPNNGTLNDSQVLLWKEEYHLKSSLGWAIGGAVIIALSILLGIMYLTAYRNIRKDQPLLSSASVSYRFVNNRDNSEDCLENVKTNLENGIYLKEVDEYQSLLLSSSNEEL